MSQHVLTTLMKRWRTYRKGRGFTELPLQPVNFGLKVEVRSCRQIYVETFEKKTTIRTSKNSHKHQIISCTCHHILLPYCIVEILDGQSSEHIGVERGLENWRKLELVLKYIRGKLPPNSNCCFRRRDVSGSIIATWMMMTKNAPSSMGKTYWS